MMKKLVLTGIFATVMMAGCATLPPPTEELDAAKVALDRAVNADATQFAPATLDEARGYYSQADAALKKGNETDARPLLNRAAAAADLAYAQAIAQVKANDAEARAKQLAELRAKLEGGAP